MTTTQTKTRFKEGQIIVAPVQKKFSCGEISIYEGEMVEVFKPEKDWYDQIRVFRGEKNKKDWVGYFIKESYFRESTPEEEKMYREGKRNISGLC